ncbi:GNAT family N-acetyltransferase [Georgenia yuyongxinii]
MTTINVTDAPEQGRYEAFVDGELAGFTEYVADGDRLVFPHTVVDPAFAGRGVGSALVRGALDDVRARGLRAVPVCSFVRSWLARHEDEYGDIVDEAVVS